MSTRTIHCALITGGAQGIGKGLARACLQRGAKVVITNTTPSVAQQTVDELSALGAIRAVCTDVTDATATQALLDDVWANEGAPDVLFSNAGAGAMKPLLDSTREDFDAQFSLNLYGALDIAQRYIRRLLDEHGTGHVMFTGSENSLVMPRENAELAMGTYGGTKHALLVMAEWLRAELRDTGVTVSTLMPAAVLTERLAETFSALESAPAGDPLRQTFTAEAEANLRKRFISPDECAQYALAGYDKGLFFIPTHAHILDDVNARLTELTAAFRALGLAAD